MENITEHMPSNLSNEELLLVQALLDRKTSQTVKTFVCKVCGLVCSSAQQLGGHQNSHRNQMQNAAKVEALGTRPALRKRKIRAPEHDDFEYGDLDEIIAGEDHSEHSGGPRPGAGAAAKSAAPFVPSASVPFGLLPPGPVPSAPRLESPSLSGLTRIRPTNNQLLYKAFFRWEHYPYAVEDEGMLEAETEPCASVTSAFLKILLAVYNAECQRKERPRNILQALAAHTRRTKVVEVPSGGPRLSEDLRRHTLEDEDGLHYSTNLDRNRYGADDNYLFTVVKHNLEFLGLCPALVDVAIIDAKCKGRTQVASVPPGACLCHGRIAKMHREKPAADGYTSALGLSTSPTSGAQTVRVGGQPAEAEGPRALDLGLPFPGLPLAVLPGPLPADSAVGLPPPKRLRPAASGLSPLARLGMAAAAASEPDRPRSRLGRLPGAADDLDDVMSPEEGAFAPVGHAGGRKPVAGVRPADVLSVEEMRRRVASLTEERDEERGLRRRAERELQGALEEVRALQALLGDRGRAGLEVRSGPQTPATGPAGDASLRRMLQQQSSMPVPLPANLLAGNVFGFPGLNLMAPAAVAALASSGLLAHLPQGSHALTSIFQQAAAIGAQAGAAANSYLQTQGAHPRPQSQSQSQPVSHQPMSQAQPLGSFPVSRPVAVPTPTPDAGKEHGSGGGSGFNSTSSGEDETVMNVVVGSGVSVFPFLAGALPFAAAEQGILGPLTMA